MLNSFLFFGDDCDEEELNENWVQFILPKIKRGRHKVGKSFFNLISSYGRLAAFLPLFFTSCSNFPLEREKQEREEFFLLSYQSGEIFDSLGKLAYKFPGGYPLIMPDGDFLVYQDQSIYKYNKFGQLLFQKRQLFTHDWDHDSDENVYLLATVRFFKDGRRIRTSEIRVLDKNGNLIKVFSPYKQIDSLQKQLGVFLEPHFFSSAFSERKFGTRLACNCWELEHFNHISILREDRVISSNLSFKKGDILFSFPIHGLVATLDPETFKVKWKMQLQGVNFFHTPVLTQRNTLLAFVNNFLDGQKILERSAIVEYDLVSQKEVWRYELTDELYSPLNGSVDISKDGNILISTMTGVNYLLIDREKLTLYLDFRKRYLNQGVDYYRSDIFSEEMVSSLRGD